jgi:hypothetical protein
VPATEVKGKVGPIILYRTAMETLPPVGRKEAEALGPEAAYFILDGTSYAANQDIEVGTGRSHVRSISRWQAQVEALRLICLDQMPQLCGCMVYGNNKECASRDWIVTPTEDWQSTESGIASARLDEMESTILSKRTFCGCEESSNSIDLSRMLKKLRLVLKLKRKKNTQVYLFIGSRMDSLMEVEDEALMADFRSLVHKVHVIAFGEECGTTTEALLQSIAKCPPDRQEDCLFPYACEHCGSVVVVQPTYPCSSAENVERLRPDFYRSLVLHNILRMKFLFSPFEDKWEEVYKKPMDQGIAGTLFKSKLETKEKRLKAIAGTLSSYYSDYVQVEAAVHSDSSNMEEDERQRVSASPSTASNLPPASAMSTGCGRQALHGQVSASHVKYMFGLSISNPGRKQMKHIAVDAEELNNVLQVFMKPLVRLRCGRLLKSFGRDAGKLRGKMKLSAQSRKLGSLELWISFDQSLVLIWSKGDKKKDATEVGGDSHALLRIPGNREQWKSEMVLKKLSQDPSGRSFALCRIGANGAQSSMHCFWLSTLGGDDDDPMFAKLQACLQNPPGFEDLLSEKQCECLKNIQRSIQSHSEKLSKGVVKQMMMATSRKRNPLPPSLPSTSSGGMNNERKAATHTFKGNWMMGKLRPKPKPKKTIQQSGGSKGNNAVPSEKEIVVARAAREPLPFVKEKDAEDVEFEKIMTKLENLKPSDHESDSQDKTLPDASPPDVGKSSQITNSESFRKSEEPKTDSKEEQVPKNVSLDNLFRFF